MPAIEVRHLRRRFGPVRAVDDLSFEVGDCAITGFLGPNGAGKTTTLRMILGLIRCTSGDALIGGKPYRDLVQPRRTVGSVLEASGFHPGRTARNHLRIVAQSQDISARQISDVLDRVGLAEDADRRVRHYSLGMRQRLALATALLGDPAILILDEPSNGLDPAGIAWLRTLLRDFASAGGTVLISSHVLSEVSQLIDSAVIISGGQLRYSGPLSGLGALGEVQVKSPLEAEFIRLTQPQSPPPPAPESAPKIA